MQAKEGLASLGYGNTGRGKFAGYSFTLRREEETRERGRTRGKVAKLTASGRYDSVRAFGKRRATTAVRIAKLTRTHNAVGVRAHVYTRHSHARSAIIESSLPAVYAFISRGDGTKTAERIRRGRRMRHVDYTYTSLYREEIPLIINVNISKRNICFANYPGHDIISLGERLSDRYAPDE